MKKYNINRLISIILIFILVLTIAPTANSEDNLWWDKNWSFKQKIIIPFDTSQDKAKYQPIDTHIIFENICWAKSEKEHSIRIISENNGIFEELECQIYDVKYNGEGFLIECNIVFLIPNSADGSERYFVYYADEPKQGPNYFDHVKVEESYYSYEPIPSYAMESNFFNIVDDSYSIYQIAYNGKYLNQGTSQYVTKLVDKSTEVRPENGELGASFEFKYYPEYAKEILDMISSSHTLVSKEILNDGNLMIEVGIISKTENSEIQTTAFYKYYHCPGKDKRVHVCVKHEAKKDFYTSKRNPLSEGTFAILTLAHTKSNAIKELNFGYMLPFLHFYDEKNSFREYPMNLDPEYIPPGYPTIVIDDENDVNLGKESWVSFDNGETGFSHALIFNNNSVLKSGSNERDGMQIRASEYDFPHLPGLECNSQSVTVGRNTYEPGQERDYCIPRDFVAEFYADFYSSDKGYKDVQKETEIFKKLVEIKPSNEKIISGSPVETGDSSLTVFLHNDKSLEFGSGISALTGIDISYETIELYKENKLVRSGSPSKIDTKKLSDEFKPTNFESIKSFFSGIDLKSISFFKKIEFSNLEPGTYLVRIFRENCKVDNQRKLVGFKTIQVKGNISTHVVCKPSGCVSICVFDQNNKPINNVICKLSFDDVVVSDDLTDLDGKVVLTAPINLKKSYFLSMYYNGFKIYEDTVKLGLLQILKPVENNIKINLYNLEIRLLDKLGLPPSVKLNPVLTSSQMNKSVSLLPTDIYEDTGIYIFRGLIPAEYQINIGYNDNSFTESIKISSDETINIVFPVQYSIKTNICDTRGNNLKDLEIEFCRENKKIRFDSSDSDVLLPPGIYELKVYSNDNLIGQRKINVIRDSDFLLITSQESFFSSAITIILIVLLLILSFVFLRKKNYKIIIKLIAVTLAFITIVSPWWGITGSSENQSIKTFTNMYLTPPSLITLTTSDSVIAGEVSYLPDLLILVLNILTALIILSCILIVLNIILEKNKFKKLGCLMFYLGFLGLVFSIAIFSVSVTILGNVSVGGSIGSGNINITIPGETSFQKLSCTWGPGIGFYLLMTSILIIFCLLIIHKKSLRFDRGV